MKRRLSGENGEEEAVANSAKEAVSIAVMSEEIKQMVAQMISKEILAGLLGGSDGGALTKRTRFGTVAFGANDEASVNAFLHQKLGKENLTRRPGPGGRRLTYIESCKAIELANQAFGFNGWSCRVIECKEEFREKRSDRWSIGFSSLVKIELKDGTSHEDVGFGQAEGQKDLGAAIEQAKKASISDARKRALRLFGEYLGNSCYDREHIREVHSNKPMAINAAPLVVLGRAPDSPPSTVVAAAHTAPPPAAPAMNPPQQPNPGNAPPGGSMHMRPTPQSNTNSTPQLTGQQTSMTSLSTSHPPSNPTITANATASRISALHAAKESKRQAPQFDNGEGVGGASYPMQQHIQQPQHPPPSVAQPTGSYNQPLRQPLQPQRPIVNNAPPPSRMAGYQPPLPAIIKTEAQKRERHVAEYDMNDLSMSQFDYDPDSDAAAVKRMRS